MSLTLSHLPGTRNPHHQFIQRLLVAQTHGPCQDQKTPVRSVTYGKAQTIDLVQARTRYSMCARSHPGPTCVSKSFPSFVRTTARILLK